MEDIRISIRLTKEEHVALKIISAKSGISIQEVSEFVRHRSILTTMQYSKELNQRNSQIANTRGDFVF